MSANLIALAGQPNCGKSTVFNALTGASQHVANYPGVTVEKKSGSFKYKNEKFHLVDLPGTYSLTSYSLEERVARDFILDESPEITINVVDSVSIKRSLFFTLQVMEMGKPIVLFLNMMDMVDKAGMTIDCEKLSRRLGITVVPGVMKKGKGKKELLESVHNISEGETKALPETFDYGILEPYLREIQDLFGNFPDYLHKIPSRWVAIKLLENDEGVKEKILGLGEDVQLSDIIDRVDEIRDNFEKENNESSEMFISKKRFEIAEEIIADCVTRTETVKKSVTDMIDSVVCNKIGGPVILVIVIYLLYYLSIVQGYNLTNYTWPLLAKIRTITENIMPASGFIEEPLIRAFALWFVDSVNALLNYIPIFFILFGLIAFLEDCGYMPRMAFIMDRLLNRFGLHGQSTLPMVLGGIYVGGCAVPGVMSCKGIPDEKSRLATILIIPLLNCLAKVPLYVLLINIYFAAHKGLAMFFISTVSLLFVLPVSKILTLTILKNRETAPFVMELPAYHFPSVSIVLKRSIERVWLFLKKITTIVAAVAVIIFALLQFPGISKERMNYYNAKKDKAIASFMKVASKTKYADAFKGEKITDLVNFYTDYKSAKMKVSSNKEASERLDEKFKAKNEVFFAVVKKKGDKNIKKLSRSLKKLVRERKKLMMAMKKERIDKSFLGRAGKSMEPFTKYAGFNWKVNVALLSALAAKESSVATLGALYQQDESGGSLESRMEKDAPGFTPLHALALMLFMVLYPPCIATAIAVKLQSGGAKWMLFSMTYPMIIGILVASGVFSISKALNLSGLQAMFGFYAIALAFTITMGFVKNKDYEY
ncbi:MAG: ferrous iron transport protein B [Deltaproteobacteria bacterium]|nr:MAG: ferrous iron transport protein B [Deltaproteobacteria bacterium]